MTARSKSTGSTDVLIVGGGPAGLSAALVLARARRRVIVCDQGHPRNAASRGLHGYLTRDGIDPREFLRLAREEVAGYGAVFLEVEVARLSVAAGGFEAALKDGDLVHSRAALIATGVSDRVPSIEGFPEMFGISVHHCPYCDGWEWRDRPLAVYGHGHSGAELAHTLLGWSRDIVLCTDGPARMSRVERDALVARGIRVETRSIARLDGADGRLRSVVFGDGEALPRDAMFLATGNVQACSLAIDLGCRFTGKGALHTDADQCTTIRRLYAAGDATRDAQFVIVAAAEGAKAAVAIHEELLREERELAVASHENPAGSTPPR